MSRVTSTKRYTNEDFTGVSVKITGALDLRPSSYLKIPTGGYYFDGTEWSSSIDEQTRVITDYRQSLYCPEAKLLAFFVPASFFANNATRFDQFKTDVDLASSVDNYRTLLKLLGEIAERLDLYPRGYDSCRRGHGSLGHILSVCTIVTVPLKGVVSREDAEFLTKHSANMTDPRIQEELDRVRKRTAITSLSQVAGFIFTVSWAQNGDEDKDIREDVEANQPMDSKGNQKPLTAQQEEKIKNEEMKRKMEKCPEVMVKAKVILTHKQVQEKKMSQTRTYNHKTTELSSMKLSLNELRDRAKNYVPLSTEGFDNCVANNLESSSCPLNIYNILTLKNALTKALRVWKVDPEFCNLENWKMRLDGDKYWSSPMGGRFTIRVNGSELLWSTLSHRFFPFVPRDVTTIHQGPVSDILLQEWMPHPSEGTGHMDDRSRKAIAEMEIARVKVSSGESAMPFSNLLAARIVVEREASARAQLIADTDEARRELDFEMDRKAAENFAKVFHGSNSDLDDVHIQMAQWFEEFWQRTPKMSIPFRKSCENLSMFGEMVAVLGMYFETHKYLHGQHALATVLVVAITCIYSFTYKMLINPLIMGPAAAGKSTVIDVLKALLIPGTWKDKQSETAKAAHVANNRHRNFVIWLWDEMQPMLLLGAKGKGGVNAQTDEQGRLRAHLTSMERCFERLEKSEDTGELLNHSVRMTSRELMLLLTNAEVPDFATNMLSRMTRFEQGYITHPNRTLQDRAIKTDPSADTISDESKQNIEDWYRRNQVFTVFVHWMMFTRPKTWRLETTMTDDFIARTLDRINKESPESVTRAGKVIKMLICEAVIKESLTVFFDSTMSPIRHRKDGKTFQWTDFVDFQFNMLLVPQIKHAVWAIDSLSHNLGQGEVFNTIQAAIRTFFISDFMTQTVLNDLQDRHAKRVKEHNAKLKKKRREAENARTVKEYEEEFEEELAKNPKAKPEAKKKGGRRKKLPEPPSDQTRLQLDKPKPENTLVGSAHEADELKRQLARKNVAERSERAKQAINQSKMDEFMTDDTPSEPSSSSSSSSSPVPMEVDDEGESKPAPVQHDEKDAKTPQNDSKSESATPKQDEDPQATQSTEPLEDDAVVPADRRDKKMEKLGYVEIHMSRPQNTRISIAHETVLIERFVDKIAENHISRSSKATMMAGVHQMKSRKCRSLADPSVHVAAAVFTSSADTGDRVFIHRELLELNKNDWLWGAMLPVLCLMTPKPPYPERGEQPIYEYFIRGLPGPNPAFLTVSRLSARDIDSVLAKGEELPLVFNPTYVDSQMNTVLQRIGHHQTDKEGDVKMEEKRDGKDASSSTKRSTPNLDKLNFAAMEIDDCNIFEWSCERQFNNCQLSIDRLVEAYRPVFMFFLRGWKNKQWPRPEKLSDHDEDMSIARALLATDDKEPLRGGLRTELAECIEYLIVGREEVLLHMREFKYLLNYPEGFETSGRDFKKNIISSSKERNAEKPKILSMRDHLRALRNSRYNPQQAREMIEDHAKRAKSSTLQYSERLAIMPDEQQPKTQSQARELKRSSSSSSSTSSSSDSKSSIIDENSRMVADHHYQQTREASSSSSSSSDVSSPLRVTIDPTLLAGTHRHARLMRTMSSTLGASSRSSTTASGDMNESDDEMMDAGAVRFHGAGSSDEDSKEGRRPQVGRSWNFINNSAPSEILGNIEERAAAGGYGDIRVDDSEDDLVLTPDRPVPRVQRQKQNASDEDTEPFGFSDAEEDDSSKSNFKRTLFKEKQKQSSQMSPGRDAIGEMMERMRVNLVPVAAAAPVASEPDPANEVIELGEQDTSESGNEDEKKQEDSDVVMEDAPQPVDESKLATFKERLRSFLLARWDHENNQHDPTIRASNTNDIFRDIFNKAERKAMHDWKGLAADTTAEVWNALEAEMTSAAVVVPPAPEAPMPVAKPKRKLKRNADQLSSSSDSDEQPGLEQQSSPKRARLEEAAASSEPVAETEEQAQAPQESQEGQAPVPPSASDNNGVAAMELDSAPPSQLTAQDAEQLNALTSGLAAIESALQS